MTTITLLAYADGHPETGNAVAPKIPLTLDIDYTEKEILDYKVGEAAGTVGIAIRKVIEASKWGQDYELIGWKLSSITIVGATTSPAPTGLQLTIHKTVATRSVEHVDMTNHWTAFGAYVTDWLDDPDNDCVLEVRFGYVLESYFRTIAGASITSLVVKA